MGKITFHQPGGDADVVNAEPGTSLMRAAVNNGIRGIIGECGGQAMCATCHVYVREPYLESLPALSEDEDEMLDSTAAIRMTRSRLGCQVLIAEHLDEIEVDVPPTQV
ncbi:2Fe-2S iron-sulfur cluster-binding protein [Mycobacterium avium]|jgi:2Fe-2S ferredoxin|uniref:2Fe-2S iron-sulfur cluster-binding protein n=1 Tax=Mycobacterium avium TaxID=1764 RepID=UPI0007A03C3A|nr:2Fe-2S iron-sulfur cluster-binding protein [Mycobacterium avium]MBZ4522647.1 2Fe-2S iron-sulfur cluster binding domain-containing protein [Mycobacterium avium subsp. hominissuis]MBZ4533069.1 2Fe-2S iron-sulfur cluster binding domain-containing protein [Mycobacterium avium subsp. hominissuis]